MHQKPVQGIVQPKLRVFRAPLVSQIFLVTLSPIGKVCPKIFEHKNGVSGGYLYCGWSSNLSRHTKDSATRVSRKSYILPA